ncbi:hypothetical protein [Aestuariirhabdus litorea]|uniref:NnrS family protein n=1 Tax=Aestuariirhabdus litorea TaxID=2528527 RepID=A0A3P3VUU7_9GAMM|nr:hypothetical protein [Aestuariirhabdus litorea]RRJ85209.1 hypothetical protein D0544_09120 [Aestuariirhabdus litorea]RWW98430.1 hypothetical protein DZC74_09105 [Endozoicomonadaceae bacterium GTF-13]
MNSAGLNFSHIPPLSVPFRFFISASLFGLLAGGLLLLAPFPTAAEGGLANRWHPALLGVTHLLVLGVILMVMFGALFQILPVVGAPSVTRPAARAALIHPLLCLGTLALGGGFMLLDTEAGRWGLRAALLLLPAALLLGMASYLPPVLAALRHNATLRQASWALLALAVTLLLGVWQLLGWNLPGRFPLNRGLTNLHALWGSLGWCLLLIGAVAYQVVPMFHTTPAVPAPVQRFSAPLLVLLLAGLSLSQVWPALKGLFEGLLSLYTLALALGLLWNLSRRKRRVADATLRAWQLAATSLLLTVPLYWLGKAGWVSPSLAFALLLYGAILSVVVGMLLKISAFLLYLHLQQRCGDCFEAFGQLPKMHELVTPQQGSRLLQLHLLALLLVLGAVAGGLPAALVGIALCAEFGYLLGLQYRALRRYRQACRRIDPLLARTPTMPTGFTG